MSEREVPKPEINLPVVEGSRSPKRLIVTLPQADFMTCAELAHQIADACDPWRSNGRSGYPARRADLSETTTSGSPYPTTGNSPYPRSKPIRALVKHLGQYRGAPYSPRWDPSMVSLEERDPHLARWLEEVERRLRDLQKWVDRGEISIVGSNRVKYQQVAHDTYVKSQDAVRYCQQSGFEVAVDWTISGTASAALVQETTASPISAGPREAMTFPVPIDTARKQEPPRPSARKHVDGKPKPSGNTRITAYVDDFVDKTAGSAKEVLKKLMSHLKSAETRPEFVSRIEKVDRKQGNRTRRELVVIWENEYGVESRTGQKTIADRIRRQVRARESANNRSPSGEMPLAPLGSSRAPAVQTSNPYDGIGPGK
jgi:hypothetical protein